MRAIDLPSPILRRAPDTRTSNAPLMTSEASEAPARIARLHFLVVGDVPRVIALLCRAGYAGDKDGCAIDGAFDGPTGRARAAHMSYDLIILDVLCAGLDGPALCRQMRADGVASLLLILNGRPTPADAIARLDAGADAYLAGPVDGPDLRAPRGLAAPARPRPEDARARSHARPAALLASL